MWDTSHGRAEVEHFAPASVPAAAAPENLAALEPQQARVRQAEECRTLAVLSSAGVRNIRKPCVIG